nr:GNAT family N-acetyltransferase [Lachnoanaerobaculum sp. OBRC5-5]
MRPTKEKERIRSMFENANLIYFAYNNGELIGLARCVTDFSYCCYLSDLAVKKEYQKQGVGKKLIEKVREHIGEKVSLILLSANPAMNYYPKIDFEKADNAFIIKRKS